MSSLKKRLFTTLLGIPLLLIVIFLLPQFEHLAFAIVVTVFTLLGSKEIYKIIKIKFNINPNLPYFFCGIIPIASWLSSFTGISNLTELALILLLIISFTIEIFSGSKSETPFSDSISTIALDSFALIYPGYLLSFIIKVNAFDEASKFYALFLLTVFSNDIFAYIFGMLLGKNSRGFIKASPNKSVVGFIGGILSSIIICCATWFILNIPLNIVEILIIGLALSLTANIGDLIESVIKRSANVKDAGKIIPGRGGALDNLDSLMVCAPLFFLLLEIFLK